MRKVETRSGGVIWRHFNDDPNKIPNQIKVDPRAAHQWVRPQHASQQRPTKYHQGHAQHEYRNTSKRHQQSLKARQFKRGNPVRHGNAAGRKAHPTAWKKAQHCQRTSARSRQRCALPPIRLFLKAGPVQRPCISASASDPRHGNSSGLCRGGIAR